MRDMQTRRDIMVNAYFRRVVVVEWDQIQKEASMSRLKKVMGLMLAGTLSLGIAVSAYAAESVMRAPKHVHIFNADLACYNSFSSGTHRYVLGYRVDPDTVELIPIYAECGIVVYQYKGTWKCACGATDGPAYRTEERHMNCGL